MSDNSDFKTLIRPAQIADAAGITNVHINSWRQTYAGLLPGEFLADMPLAFHQRMNFWSKTLAEIDGKNIIWVAENHRHGIVGFAAAGKTRDNRFQEYGELNAIYLLHQYQGRKIGYELLKKIFSDLAAQNFLKAFCWVLIGNPAISFYERNGAVISNETKNERIGSKEVVELACLWDNLATVISNNRHG